jgi:hypothetical protein
LQRWWIELECVGHSVRSGGEAKRSGERRIVVVVIKEMSCG